MIRFDQIDDVAVGAANKLVEALDKRDISGYVTLAKAALWLAGIASLAALVSACIQRDLGVVCQAAQVLVMLAVSVLGFHHYQGSRILHIIRHWNDGKNDACPTETKTNSA